MSKNVVLTLSLICSLSSAVWAIPCSCWTQDPKINSARCLGGLATLDNLSKKQDCQPWCNEKLKPRKPIVGSTVAKDWQDCFKRPAK